MKEKTRVISFSGKGGSGKTTTASMFVSSIVKKGIFKQILVIDADPDANLATTLGITPQESIGTVMDRRKRDLDEQNDGEKLRYDLWNAITHGDDFDFLKMGRTKGPGCYCSINSVLNSLLIETMNMYDLILIDFDAGLEHFSRRVGSTDDALVVTCDPSALSFETATRIKEMVNELALPYQNLYLVGCRYAEEDRGLFHELADETGYKVLGMIRYDKEIARANIKGIPLLDLDDSNPSMQEVNRMVDIVIDV